MPFRDNDVMFMIEASQQGADGYERLKKKQLEEALDKYETLVYGKELPDWLEVIKADVDFYYAIAAYRKACTEDQQSFADLMQSSYGIAYTTYCSRKHKPTTFWQWWKKKWL